MGNYVYLKIIKGTLFFKISSQKLLDKKFQLNDRINKAGKT